MIFRDPAAPLRPDDTRRRRSPRVRRPRVRPDQREPHDGELCGSSEGLQAHQSDSRKTTSASRSALVIARKLSRERAASPPCQRIASAETAGAPVMHEERMSVHCLDETDAPERGGPPLATRGFEVGAAVGEFRPHVVEQQVGKRMDGLLAIARGIRRPPPSRDPGVAARAPRRVEQLAPAPDVEALDVSSPGDRKRLRVEVDLLEERSRSCGVGPVGALRHFSCAEVHPSAGKSSEVDPHVAQERAGILWVRLGWFAFHPKRPSTVACLRVPDVVRSPRDAVAIAVVGIGELEDRVLGNGFEQTEPRRERAPCAAKAGFRDGVVRSRACRYVYVGRRSEYGVPSAKAPGTSTYVTRDGLPPARRGLRSPGADRRSSDPASARRSALFPGSRGGRASRGTIRPLFPADAHDRP